MPQATARKNSVRRDPPASVVNFDDDLGQRKNEDPNKHYVWVYKAGQVDQIGMYENRGYEVELHKPNGVRSAVQRKDKPFDTPVEWMGNVLMSIDKADLAIQEARGQAKVDRIESAIIDRNGAVDPLRGIGNSRRGRKYVGLENLTEEAEQELSE